MPRVPGATEELVLHEIFAALRELCEDGSAWIDTLKNVGTKANNRNIYLDPLADGNKVGYVFQVKFNAVNSPYGKALTPLTVWPSSTEQTADNPLAYYMADTGHILLNPTPSQAHPNAYDITMSIIPCSDKVRLPVEFSSHWRDAVIQGTCERMMTMVSKPWSSTRLAVFHGRKFRNHIKRARYIAKTRFSPGDAVWRFPSGFARGHQRIRW
jgi:hypothetical protein